jgi:hypothetical protein
MSSGCWRRVIETNFGRQEAKRKDREYGEGKRLGILRIEKEHELPNSYGSSRS